MPQFMNAVRVQEFGEPDVMKVERVRIPKVGRDEVLIEVEYSGVNMVDTYWRRGLPGYRSNVLPFSLGMEASGTIVAVGEEVQELRNGDRVVALMHRGSYAGYFAVPAWKVVPMPHHVDFSTGAALALQAFTAYFLTHQTYEVSANDRVLVHAAAGGVGAHIAAFSASKGAEVIGTCSSTEKERRARSCGCAKVIRYDQSDFATEVNRITNGDGVNVVYDSVGRTTFESGLECLSPRGLMCLFGQSSGPVDPVDPQLLRAHGSLYMTRPTLSDYMQPRDNLLAIAENAFHAESPALNSLRIQKYTLNEVAAAHMALETRSTSGKLVIAVHKSV